MFGVWRFLAFWYSCCFPKDCCWSSSYFELSTFMSLSEIVAGYIQPWAGPSIFPCCLTETCINSDMRLTCNLRQNLNAADFQLLEFPLQCCLGFCARPELCSSRSSCLWPKGALSRDTVTRWWCPDVKCQAVVTGMFTIVYLYISEALPVPCHGEPRILGVNHLNQGLLSTSVLRWLRSRFERWAWAFAWV